MSATRVILVRHGESTFNTEGRVQGHIDQSSLTPQGIATARQAGAALTGISLQAIYVSPLQRAQQTVQEILATLHGSTDSALPEAQVLPELIEISLPLWEGLKFDEVKQKYPDGYQFWREQPHLLEMATADGTSFYPVQELFERAQRLWERLLPRHGGDTIMLVGHSGINRALICTALGISPDRYHRLQQSNCGISVLNFPAGWGSGVQLETLNITSHLRENLPKPRKGTEGLRVLLVRHGETDWNRQGRFQGQIDVPLNANGRQQGLQVAAFLASVPITSAISSSMARPRETAELILQHHPQVEMKLMDELREISHGTWEGKLEPEVAAEYPGELERWRTTPAAIQMPEGENLQQVWERAIAAWESIIAEARARAQGNQILLVVAHDAINKVILCHVTGVGPEQFWHFKQGNGAVSVIDYPGATDYPVLQAMNITTHMGGVLDKTAAGAL